MGVEEGWVGDDGAEEFLLRDLLEVGEVEFGEEVLEWGGLAGTGVIAGDGTV